MEALIFNSYKYILAFFSAFIVTYLLTPLIRKIAPVFGMVDQPGERRIHKKPTPRGGGLAIVIAVHLTFIMAFKLGWTEYAGNMDYAWWKSFLLGSILIVWAGLFDDIKGINPWVKLGCQALAGTILFAGGTRFGVLFGATLPMPIDYLVTLFWILALTNAFNLIDGLDGLATGLCIIAALGLAGALFFRRLPTDTLIAGSRLSFRGVRDLMSIANLQEGNNHHDNPVHVLLYGGGDRCMMFLREYSYRPRENGARRIIAGIVDDDPNLRKRLVSGLKVLGNRQDLSTIIPEHGIDLIIITANLEPEIVSEIREIAGTQSVKIINWYIEEREI